MSNGAVVLKFITPSELNVTVADNPVTKLITTSPTVKYSDTSAPLSPFGCGGAKI